MARRANSLWEFLKTVIYAVIIATVIRTFAYEPFNIPSGSMIPTLLVGDYLFVSKFSYGFSQYSFPFGIVRYKGRLLYDRPKRGDVAVFKLPRPRAGRTRDNGNQDFDQPDYIKRIVGLPGDKIQVINGVLHINAQPVRREQIEDFAYDHNGSQRVVRQYRETLPNGVSYNVLDEFEAGRLDNTEIYDVPEGYFFAMGDNRDRSADSRVLDQVGFIPAENLIGRAEIIFFSTDGGARLWEFWRWPFATRFSRLGQLL